VVFTESSWKVSFFWSLLLFFFNAAFSLIFSVRLTDVLCCLLLCAVYLWQLRQAFRSLGAVHIPSFSYSVRTIEALPVSLAAFFCQSSRSDYPLFCSFGLPFLEPSPSFRFLKSPTQSPTARVFSPRPAGAQPFLVSVLLASAFFQT